MNWKICRTTFDIIEAGVLRFKTRVRNLEAAEAESCRAIEDLRDSNRSLRHSNKGLRRTIDKIKKIVRDNSLRSHVDSIFASIMSIVNEYLDEHERKGDVIEVEE